MHTGTMGRIVAFCSYAHEDARLLAELKAALAPLREQAVIDDWSDLAIAPGTDWDAQIRDSLDRAHVVLFLVTPALLASRFVTEREIPHALSRRAAERCEVVPILGRRPRDEADWHASALAALQPLPQVGMWLDDHRSPADAWAAVRLGVGQVCARIGGSDNPYRRSLVGDWRQVLRRMDFAGLSAKWEYTETLVEQSADAAVLQLESTMTGAVQRQRVVIDLRRPLGGQSREVAAQIGLDLTGANGMASSMPAGGIELAEEVVSIGFQQYQTTVRTMVVQSELDGLRMETRTRQWTSIDVPFDGTVRTEMTFTWSNGARAEQSARLLAFGFGDAEARRPTPAAHGGVPPALAGMMGGQTNSGVPAGAGGGAFPLGSSRGTPHQGMFGGTGPFTPAPMIWPGRWGLQASDGFGQPSFDVMLHPDGQLHGLCWTGGQMPWQLSGRWWLDPTGTVLSYDALATAPGMPPSPSRAAFQVVGSGPAGLDARDATGRPFRIWRMG